jgi:DMSO reductase family type II enzyme chaperone
MTSTQTQRFPTGDDAANAVALLYLAYARLLGFPDSELTEAVRSGEVMEELQTLHAASDVGSARKILYFKEDLEQQYIATFEVGSPESPAPLYESAYGGNDGEGRRSTLEELTRFYEFFDLDLGERPAEQPDHLTVELEFMAVLAQMESQARAQFSSGNQFQLAQRDFLSRHLKPFVSTIRRRAVPTGFYSSLLDSLSTFLESEHRRLLEACGPAAHHPPHTSIVTDA